jgi:hypothetical protein
MLLAQVQAGCPQDWGDAIGGSIHPSAALFE